VLAGITAVLVVTFGLWSVGHRIMDIDVDPLRIGVVSETELQVLVSCAEDVTVEVSETANAVRIDDVGGRAIDGDCLGETRIRLSRPLGERRVFVEGKEWERDRQLCESDGFRPPGSPRCRYDS
jgi:hypothetical protein